MGDPGSGSDIQSRASDLADLGSPQKYKLLENGFDFGRQRKRWTQYRVEAHLLKVNPQSAFPSLCSCTFPLAVMISRLSY